MARYQFSDHAELRAVAHVDMDCFYVQVEQRRNPELKGKPTAVVQYNAWRGGGLIAVGYEARAVGVKKQMRGDDARACCPDVNLVTVPTAHGKADLTIYRKAGAEVVSILSRKGRCERASIDEVYLDLTEAAKDQMEHMPENKDGVSAEAGKSHVLGNSDNPNDTPTWLLSRADYSDKLLAAAALIVAELREAVRTEARFSCSAGIAHNKMLAKLASNMHKPAQQTVVPLAAVPGLYEELPLKKLRQLGGKLGASLEAQLGVKTAGDLMRVPLETLQDMHGKNVGMWLYRMSRGLDDDPVRDRVLPKSHGCSKTFPGRNALVDLPGVRHWVQQLALELDQRLEMDCEQNGRFARLLVASVTFCTDAAQAASHNMSKSCPIVYGAERVAADAFGLVKRVLSDYGSFWVISMGLSATNLQTTPEKTSPITSFLTVCPAKQKGEIGGSKREGDNAEGKEGPGKSDRENGANQAVDASGRDSAAQKSEGVAGDFEDVENGKRLDESGASLGGGSIGEGCSDQREAVSAGKRTGTGGVSLEGLWPKEAKRKPGSVVRNGKRKTSPLQAWLAAADGSRSGGEANGGDCADRQSNGGEKERSGEFCHRSQELYDRSIELCDRSLELCDRLNEGLVRLPVPQSDAALPSMFDPERFGGSEPSAAVLRSADAGAEHVAEESNVSGGSGLERNEGNGVTGDCDDVQLTLGEWVPPQESTDSKPGAGVPGAGEERTPGVENQAVATGEATTWSFPTTESGDRLTTPGRLAGNAASDEGLVQAGLSGIGSRESDEEMRPQTGAVRLRVEAPKSLEALWQKAAVADVNGRKGMETPADVTKRPRGNAQQTLSKKRPSEDSASDAREKLQKLWARASTVENERGRNSHVGQCDFDLQHVDRSTLEELPKEIQDEIRAAQRLQLQRQQPKASLKKPVGAQHARNIMPYFQKKH